MNTETNVASTTSLRRSNSPIAFERVFELPGNVSDIFDYLADNRNEVQWNRYLARVDKLTPGPVGPGTRYRDYAHMMGVNIPFSLAIDAYEPPTHVTQVGKFGAVRYVLSYMLQPVDGRAEVTLRFEGTLPRLLRPAAEPLGRVFQHRFDTAIAGLVRHSL
jgi:hypothetical protein